MTILFVLSAKCSMHFYGFFLLSIEIVVVKALKVEDNGRSGITILEQLKCEFQWNNDLVFLCGALTMTRMAWTGKNYHRRYCKYVSNELLSVWIEGLKYLYFYLFVYKGLPWILKFLFVKKEEKVNEYHRLIWTVLF